MQDKNPNIEKYSIDAKIDPKRTLSMILHHDIVQQIVGVVKEITQDTRYKNILNKNH